MKPDRIVIGTHSEKSGKCVRIKAHSEVRKGTVHKDLSRSRTHTFQVTKRHFVACFIIYDRLTTIHILKD